MIPMPKVRSVRILVHTPIVLTLLLTRAPIRPSITLTHSIRQDPTLHSLLVPTVQAAVIMDTLNRAVVVIEAMAMAQDQTMADTLALLPTMAMAAVVVDLSVVPAVIMAVHLAMAEAVVLVGMAPDMDLEVQVDEARLLPTTALETATTTDTHPGVPALALEATGNTLHSSSAILIMAVHIRLNHGTCPPKKKKKKQNKNKSQQTTRPARHPQFRFYVLGGCTENVKSGLTGY